MKERLLKWLSVALLASMATANVQGQSAELIAFWDFEQIDADGETIRSSDGQWAGVITGDAVLTENGGGRPNGGGRGFDVSEANPGHLVLEAEGDENPMNLAAENDQVSIVFWQKNFTNVNSSSFWAVAEDSDRHVQFHVPWSNGIIYFDSMGCCAQPATRLQQAPGEDHEWEEEWHHYAFVKDGPIKQIYVDGALLIEQEGSNPLSTSVTAIHIGAQSNGDQPDGVIDDFALFKGVLTTDEIAGFAAGDSPGVPPVDTDGDGIPDRWEEQYGFDINDPADAALDPDEDGDTNLAEFNNGTNPVDTTDPTLVAVTTDCSRTTIVLEFSERLDAASASDPANYSISPELEIMSVEFKKDTVTLTTAQQEVASSYIVKASNVADQSKNTVPDDSTGTIYTCVEITEGVLRFAAWNDIPGTPVTALFDDGRYPDNPDVEGPVFSINSRDIYPGNENNNFGAVMEGWLTPAESGDYDFFLRSDDGSELWISTDDSPSNLVFQAEELDCCDPFEEVGSDATTFAPVSLEAGEKYFIQVLYKEGGGGDFAQVAWRLDGDDTPAADLQPIPGQFLSSAVPLLAPAEGSFVTQVPAPGAANVLPSTSISASYRSNAFEWTADNTSLAINGETVEAAFASEGGVASLSYTPDGLLPGGDVAVDLTYPDPVGNPVTESWIFSVVEYFGPTLDSVGSYPGLVAGNAVFTADGGGRSGATGDYGMDFTEDGGSIIVTEYDYLNAAAANDELTVVYWGKKHAVGNSSAFWIQSASAGAGNRGFQAHAPWSNGAIFFDTQGCCAAGAQRLNGPLTDFPGYEDESFLTDAWHLFSFSKKGDVKEVRIDGELFLEGIDADPLTADITGLFIGSANNLANPDRSIFDDFAIFSTALTEADLKTIVDGGSPADLSGKGLLAYWNFNDPSSPTPVEPPVVEPPVVLPPIVLPPVPGGGTPGAITGISRAADGSISIEYTGTLQAADTVSGTYAPVAGASSPFAVDAAAGAKFYIAR